MNLPTLNVGFYNYVLVDHIVALVDFKISSVKKLVKYIKERDPRAIVDLTRGRRSVTLVMLTDNRYIISAISRRQLMNRLSMDDNEEEES